jgi:hypothetical protein
MWKSQRLSETSTGSRHMMPTLAQSKLNSVRLSTPQGTTFSLKVRPIAHCMDR